MVQYRGWQQRGLTLEFLVHGQGRKCCTRVKMQQTGCT